MSLASAVLAEKGSFFLIHISEAYVCKVKAWIL